jgi:hypothetical protein
VLSLIPYKTNARYWINVRKIVVDDNSNNDGTAQYISISLFENKTIYTLTYSKTF